MSLVIAAVVLVALVYLLHRDNAATADPYREALVDRDAQRVRADLLVGADRLPNGRRLSAPVADDWEPRA